MKAVIDIGSNSVRLLLASGSKKEKFIKITKLAEGLNSSGRLSFGAIKRTVDAVVFFNSLAISKNAEKIYCYATAAVRGASNGNEFVLAVKEACGIAVDVVSGEQEALLGLTGVLTNQDGGIIDIGGASTEITARINGKIEYAKSINIGGVRILDACGQDLQKIIALCEEKVNEFNVVPSVRYYGIGGTATSIASVLQELKVYDVNKVHGYKLTVEKVDEAVRLFASKTVEERKNITGLQPDRADVILGATILLSVIMKRFSMPEVIVSEDDNLEGYLYLKEVKNEQ